MALDAYEAFQHNTKRCDVWLPRPSGEEDFIFYLLFNATCVHWSVHSVARL